jgi:hypothetical protein
LGYFRPKDRTSRRVSLIAHAGTTAKTYASSDVAAMRREQEPPTSPQIDTCRMSRPKSRKRHTSAGMRGSRQATAEQKLSESKVQNREIPVILINRERAHELRAAWALDAWILDRESD